MRIIFWGTPEYSIASLDIFIKSKHKVIAVVTQPDKKRSRGNKLISSPVKSFAEQESIKVYTPTKIKTNIHFINISRLAIEYSGVPQNIILTRHQLLIIYLPIYVEKFHLLLLPGLIQYLIYFSKDI